MRIFAEHIDESLLPRFALIKNIFAVEWNFEGLVTGDIVALDDCDEKLIKSLPKLKKPLFWRIKKSNFYCDVLEKIPKTVYESISPEEWDSYGFRFDSDIYGLWENRTEFTDERVPDDFIRFGESYTMGWLCPNDKQRIIDHVMKNECFFKNPEKRFNVNLLWYYLDSMIVFSDDEKCDEFKLWDSVKDTLTELINKHPNGPTKQDWGILDEMLRQ